MKKMGRKTLEKCDILDKICQDNALDFFIKFSNEFEKKWTSVTFLSVDFRHL